MTNAAKPAAAVRHGELSVSAPREATETPAERRRLALSPSRANDFKTCPLLFRFRAIDRLPEAPTLPAVRGTLVHAVLEEMFTAPATERTADAVRSRVLPMWQRLAAERPDWPALVADVDLGGWLASAEDLVRTYFTLEDPTVLAPEACEVHLEVELPNGVPLRGFIDRLDVAPTGQIRIVDYKTGRSPNEAYQSDALYQLKFYGLMVYRLRGVVPTRLRLLYLGNGQVLEYSPQESELLGFEKGVVALWRAITGAIGAEHFPPRPSRLCDWCAHRNICPAFGGSPPPFPSEAAALLTAPAQG